jgi:hypothetical protein
MVCLKVLSYIFTGGSFFWFRVRNLCEIAKNRPPTSFEGEAILTVPYILG